MPMTTRKIVYNACFGGFGLSKQAVSRYAELKGFKLYTEDSEYGLDIVHYYTSPDMDEHSYFTPCEIERSDPSLVQVVEELGADANGQFAELQIAEVAVGTPYRIDEYDGLESVKTVRDYDWTIA